MEEKNVMEGLNENVVQTGGNIPKALLITAAGVVVGFVGVMLYKRRKNRVVVTPEVEAEIITDNE